MKLISKRWRDVFALVLLAVGFVLVVTLSSLWLRGARLDLTEHHQYTLSDGTQRILDHNVEAIRLRLFYSEKEAQGYPQFRVYSQRVLELIEEFVARSHGKIKLEVIDPEPFSEAEDLAGEYGLKGVPLGSSGDNLYFGLVGTGPEGSEAAMPFIQPDKEAFLEYDLAKLVSSLSVEKQPVVGLLSSLQTGPMIDASGTPRMGWAIDRQLGELFELRRLQPDPNSIGDDVDLLMLVHPKNLPDDTLDAIDQFVLRGGRLLVFVDPDAESEPANAMGEVIGATSARSSDLRKLFEAWGVQYNPNKVVLDVQNALQVQPDPQQMPVRHLAILGLHQNALNQKDIITAAIETVNLASAGALALNENSKLRMEALIQSSASSMLMATESVRQAVNNPTLLADQFKADGNSYVLAARLSGFLKSAFPERNAVGHLAASSKSANIIIVADTDLLSDRLWVQVQNFLGQQVANPFANNGDLVYNAVDNLVGNNDLIAVRTRVNANRPFGRIELMQRSAEARYQTQARTLQQTLDQLEEKLAELQPQDFAAPAPNLSREQKATLAQFQQQKVSTRKQLRAVQHQLNAQVEALGARLKLINILAMPILVILFALAVAWRRRWRRARYN